MSVGRDLTVDDLREMIVISLQQQGRDQLYIDGYIDAQERSGWLRPACPAWIRNSAGVYYALPPGASKKAL